MSELKITVKDRMEFLKAWKVFNAQNDEIGFIELENTIICQKLGLTAQQLEDMDIKDYAKIVDDLENMITLRDRSKFFR